MVAQTFHRKIAPGYQKGNKTGLFRAIFAVSPVVFAIFKLATGVRCGSWFNGPYSYFCPHGRIARPFKMHLPPAMLRLIPFFVLLFACGKNRQPAAPEVAAGGRELPKDFLDFYEKFLTDTAYQMAHIQWPLAGEETTQVVDSAQAVKTPMQWQRESWDLHRPMSLKDDSYKHEWQMLGDVLVIERVREQTTGMYIERRFAKIGNDDWQLIFYSNF